MYFRNYGLRKTWLDQCLKCPISEDPLKIYMVNAPKYSCNMKDSSFTILIDNCQGNCLTRRLCYNYAKSQVCFVRH